MSFQLSSRPSEHPLWLVGFRPFFALALLSGTLLPLIWVLAYSGALRLPTALPAVQWHAHEMFYGFGWAVLGGFLLTATKNWMQIRGYHGWSLMLLAAAWVLERVVLACGAVLPPAVFLLGANLFLPAVVVMVLHTLIRYRPKAGWAGFDDNNFFLIILPLFLVAKNLLLIPEHFAAGAEMTLALFRVAFLVMLERTVIGFMQAAFGLTIHLDPRRDRVIKGLAVLLVGAPWMPVVVVGGLSLLLATLLLWRLTTWHPRRAFSQIGVGIMYFGYLGIVLQLLAVAAHVLLGATWMGSVGTHIFTFGVMALIGPAMLIRISKGHTGRPVQFDTADRWALYAMLLGFVCRVVAPQVLPGAYLLWVTLAGLCWFACFATLAWRYLPFYFQPRVDGRTH